MDAAKPKAPVRRKKPFPAQTKEHKPWWKSYHDKGPILNGSRLIFTTASTRAIKEPQPEESAIRDAH